MAQGQNQTAPVQLHPSIPQDQLVAMINQNFEALNQANMTRVISDGTNNRIIIGKLPDGSYGIVVSKPGIDVLNVF